MPTVANEQMIVVGSSLQTVGYTSADFAAKWKSEQFRNNRKRGKDKSGFIGSYFLKCNKSTYDCFWPFNKPTEVRLWRNIICNSVCTEKNILQQTITPEDIIQTFQNSHSILPTDLLVPSTTRAANEHVLINIIGMMFSWVTVLTVFDESL